MVNYSYRKEDVERAREAMLSRIEDDILYRLAKSHVEEIDAEIKKYWNALENFCWDEMRWIVRNDAEEAKAMPDMSVEAFVNRAHTLTYRYIAEHGETSIPDLPKVEVVKFARQQSNFFKNNFDMKYVTGPTETEPKVALTIAGDRVAVDTPVRKLTEEEIPF